jgi:hypothetical protein
MKLIGYWTSESDPELPNPRDLVRPGWLGVERENLIRYLMNASFFRGSWGHSSCRFHCGVDDTDMGSSELTDGEWVWPEGLVHYVDRHEVLLPEDFIDYCRSRSWQLADISAPISRLVDDTYWRAWAANMKTENKPWVATGRNVHDEIGD